MAWIESHQSLQNHRKTGRLARKLGIPKVAAIGHLHCFWWWCMDNAPGGNLEAIDAEDIADGACFEGDPHEFLHALVYAGFVDGERPDGAWRVHDWYDYAGKLIEKRKGDAERKRADRRDARPKDVPAPEPTPLRPVQRTSSGHPADGAGTVPNRTPPNQTQPEETPPLPPEEVAPPVGGEQARDARPLPAVHATRFDAFWEAYPKKVGKKSCAAWWGKRRPDAELTQQILDSVEAHKHGDLWQRNFIKDPIRWLQEERWNDEVPPAPTLNQARAPAVQPIPTDGRPTGRTDGMISTDVLNWSRGR